MQNETAINLVEAKFCASFLSRALCQSKAVVHHSILIGSASCISARQTYLLLNEWIKFQCQLRNSKELITFIKKNPLQSSGLSSWRGYEKGEVQWQLIRNHDECKRNLMDVFKKSVKKNLRNKKEFI